MGYRVDELDKRILYRLAADARHTSAPMIAEDVDVTPATVRHRIRQLEESGVIEGYAAAIDYERTELQARTQITCTADVADRQRRRQEALGVSGVVGVRELVSGRRNLLVDAVASDTDDVARIERELSELGLDVEETAHIRHQTTQPYDQFAPDRPEGAIPLTDFRTLSGGAEVVEFTVGEDAPVADTTVEDAVEDGLLADVLVVSVERGEETLTPAGDTTIRAGDVVTLFSRDPLPEATVEAFDSDPTKPVR